MEAEVVLQRIRYTGLIGSRENVIDLDMHRPTLLTGANGTGKSTLLRLIGAVSSGDVQTLMSAPLTSLELEFSNLESFALVREGRTTILRWGKNRSVLNAGKVAGDLPEWAHAALGTGQEIDEQIDSLREAAITAGVDFETFRSVRDTLKRAGALPHAKTPPWMRELGDAFKVTYITDQRLVAEQPEEPRSHDRHLSRTTSRLAVESASREIKRDLSRADTAYARASQEIDRKIPHAILRAVTDTSTAPSAEQFSELIAQLDSRRQHLLDVGLLDSSIEASDMPLATSDDENVRAATTVVVEASLSKLRVLESLERRLSAMKAFLDERLATKAVTFSRTVGLEFRLESGANIRATDLSSGEQQMLVLAYEILFRAPRSTLIIVDEPELSLHVLWQDTLVRDLERMGAASGIRFLLATHSPMIVAAAPELERSLDLPTKK